MTRSGAPFSPLLLLFVALLADGCGSGSSSNRQLQSISITGTAVGSEFSFIATGTFSAPPTQVTPLPVSWSLAETTTGYTLTTQPFVVPCNTMGPAPLGPVTAMAPADPHAPSRGPIMGTQMVVTTTSIVCQ
jgi:hypothetical protein